MTKQHTGKQAVLHCSICNGEQVVGFKDLETGKFEEVMLIRNPSDLAEFKRKYGVDEVTKEYCPRFLVVSSLLVRPLQLFGFLIRLTRLNWS